MKKRILFWAAAVSVLTAQAAFAAGWQNGVGANAGKWWYATNDAGTTWHTNGWQWIDGNGDGVAECYYFGPDGYIYTSNYTPDGYIVDKDGKWTVNGAIQTRNVGTAAGNASGNGSNASGSGSIAETYGRNGSWKNGEGANAGKWWFDNGDGTFRKGGWHWLDGNKDGVAECYYFDNDGWLITSGNPGGYVVDATGAWVQNGTRQTKSSYASASAGTSISATGITSAGGGGGGGSSSGGGGGSSSGGSSSKSSYSDFYSSYSDRVSTGGSEYTNGPSHGGYWSKSFTQDMNDEVNDVVEEFKAKYITDGMSNFEKEIAIVRYIVANCSYDKTTENSWSAYGALVEGKAKCMGYADAFMVMGKACGLDVRYIASSTHAWNLIKLDGKWYHVDVTWEDPIGVDDGYYGYSKLRNEYINLTDAEIRSEAAHHRKWSPDKVTANSTAYGRLTVKRYLDEGVIDTNAKQYYDEKNNSVLSKYEKDGRGRIKYTNVSDTAKKVIEYIGSRIEKGEPDYCFVIDFEGKYTDYSSVSDSLKYFKIEQEIEKAVTEGVNLKYSGYLKYTYDCRTTGLTTDAGYIYLYDYKMLSYKDGKGKTVTCSITFKDEDGNAVGDINVTGYVGDEVTISYPDGYGFISNSSEYYKCTEGNISRYNGKTIKLGHNNAKVIITVSRRKTAFTLNYIDTDGNIVASENGSTTLTGSVNIDAPEGYWIIRDSSGYAVYDVSIGDKNNVKANRDSISFKTNADYTVNVMVKKNISGAYTIKYVDVSDENTVLSTQTGIVYETSTIKYDRIPEGYKISESEGKNGKIITGSGSVGSNGFRVKVEEDGVESFSANVYVEPIVEIGYTIKYVLLEDNEAIVGTQKGTVAETSYIICEVPKGYKAAYSNKICQYGKVVAGSGYVTSTTANVKVVINDDSSEDYVALIFVEKESDIEITNIKSSVIETVDDEETEAVTYEVAEEESAEAETVNEEISETAAETEPEAEETED